MTTKSPKHATGRHKGGANKSGKGHRMSFDHMAGAALSDNCRSALQSMTAKETAASWDRAFARAQSLNARATGSRAAAASWDRAFGHPSTSTR